MSESTVYILGAGCSKHCGYPLGPQMKDDLDQVAKSLDPATSPRLLKAVTDTTALMTGTTETIDILVQKLYGGHFDQQIGGNQYRHPRVKEIAQVIYISENTVKAHVKSILAKMDAMGRTEAIAIALKRGLMPLEDGGSAPL